MVIVRYEIEFDTEKVQAYGEIVFVHPAAKPEMMPDEYDISKYLMPELYNIKNWIIESTSALQVRRMVLSPLNLKKLK